MSRIELKLHKQDVLTGNRVVLLAAIVDRRLDQLMRAVARFGYLDESTAAVAA
jgi:hypothetical protein